MRAITGLSSTFEFEKEKTFEHPGSTFENLNLKKKTLGSEFEIVVPVPGLRNAHIPHDWEPATNGYSACWVARVSTVSCARAFDVSRCVYLRLVLPGVFVTIC